MASFEDRAELSATRVGELAELVKHQHMLHEVVAWTATHQPQPEIIRIVEQDEFTLDVVLRLDDVWLVYDCS
jgi:hypothetical protein